MFTFAMFHVFMNFHTYVRLQSCSVESQGTTKLQTKLAEVADIKSIGKRSMHIIWCSVGGHDQKRSVLHVGHKEPYVGEGGFYLRIRPCRSSRDDSIIGVVWGFVVWGCRFVMGLGTHVK